MQAVRAIGNATSWGDHIAAHTDTWQAASETGVRDAVPLSCAWSARGLAPTAFAVRSAAQDVTAANREVSELESDTQRLMAQRVRPHDLKSDTFVEERLTDGELYLRLEDYLRAAILLMDIVDHYPTHRAYPEALFLLGESLFLAGDYLGARKRYAEVIDRSASRRSRRSCRARSAA